jgi:hypothetical protein
MRQSPNGILIYDEKEKSEVKIEHELKGRGAELMGLYNSVVHGRRCSTMDDGEWRRWKCASQSSNPQKNAGRSFSLIRCRSNTEADDLL